MPALPLRVRTIESYLAGLGASGALIAGAVVAFILLVGIVTFNAWPTGSSVFSGGASDVAVDTSLTTTPPTRQQPSVPNLVKLLGGGGAAASATPVRAGGSSRGSQPNEQSSGGSPAQRGPQQNSQGGGQDPAQPVRNPQQTQPAQSSNTGTQPRNAVQQLAYGVGNTVEADTSSLSPTLGGDDSLLGGTVGGLGSTLNSTLQALAGNN